MELLVVGFADRLAYLRWLRARGRVRPETDGEIADAFGVKAKWLRKWKRSPVPPEGRTEAAAIEAALAPAGVSIRWLYDGVGEAPEGVLWTVWLAARAAEPAEEKLSLRINPSRAHQFTQEERAQDERNERIAAEKQLAKELAAKKAKKKTG